MCYITESAREQWANSIGDYRCDKCKKEVESVDTIRFCEWSEQEDNPETEMEVCEECKREIYKDKTLVVF